MSAYRRASVPFATEEQTQQNFARSHVVHAHHYRSESNKKPTDNTLTGFAMALWTAVVGAIFAAGFFVFGTLTGTMGLMLIPIIACLVGSGVFVFGAAAIFLGWMWQLFRLIIALILNSPKFLFVTFCFAVNKIKRNQCS